MTVTQAIATRKSVRSFEDRPVEPEVLQALMEQVRLAPSARNSQEWRFVLVTDPELRKNLADAAGGQRFVGEAPVIVVACAETDRRLMSCGHPAFLIDVAIAVDHLTLAAVEMGLGTCWIGAFDPQKVREVLGIPPEIEVVQILPLGYPKDPSPQPKRRIDYDAIVKLERW
jgi:nitroreductase